MRPMMTIPVNASETTGVGGYGNSERNRNPSDVFQPEKCECDPPPETMDKSLNCLACGRERMLWEDLDHRRAKMTDLLRRILEKDRQP